MHVYFFPATVLVIPAFEQVVPEIVAAFDSGYIDTKAHRVRIATIRALLGIVIDYEIKVVFGSAYTSRVKNIRNSIRNKSKSDGKYVQFFLLIEYVVRGAVAQLVRAPDS